MVRSQSLAWSSADIAGGDEVPDRRNGLRAGIFDGELHVNDSQKNVAQPLGGHIDPVADSSRPETHSERGR